MGFCREAQPALTLRAQVRTGEHLHVGGHSQVGRTEARTVRQWTLEIDGRGSPKRIEREQLPPAGKVTGGG